MTRTAQLLPLAGALFGGLLLSGCAASISHEPRTEKQPHSQVVEVAERSVTDAISLNAIAEAGTSFTMTAASHGQLIITSRAAAGPASLPGATPATQQGIHTATLPVPNRPHSGGLPDAPDDESTEPLHEPEAKDQTQEGGDERGTPDGKPAAEQFDPKLHQFWFQHDDGGQTELFVPATSTSVEARVPLATRVEPNTPILQITDSAILLRSKPEPAQVLRMGTRIPQQVRAQIIGASGPFDCRPTDQRLSLIDQTLYFSCRPPENTPVVVGATGRIVAQFATHEGVLTLPVEAVAGSIESGYIYLESDPTTQVPITLGISDGAYVEVVDGVSLGDKVLVPSPSLLEENHAPSR